MLAHWLDASLPAGAITGFDLTETFDYFADMPHRGMDQLYRPSPRPLVRRQLDLWAWGHGLPHSLAEACRPFAIPTGRRGKSPQPSDDGPVSPDIVVAGLATDSIAAFRLAVALAAKKSADDGFRSNTEQALFAWIAASELISARVHLAPPAPVTSAGLRSRVVPLADALVRIDTPSPTPPLTRRQIRELLLANARAAFIARRGLDRKSD